MEPEILKPTEVQVEVSELISQTVGALAASQVAEPEIWYHDMPVWFAGDIQLSLVRESGQQFLDLHFGDYGYGRIDFTNHSKETLLSTIAALTARD